MTAATHVQKQRQYDRDKRVRAARHQYRVDLANGMPEREAWKNAVSVYGEVRRELGLKEEGSFEVKS